jgi:NADPH-dependent F420 reductase
MRITLIGGTGKEGRGLAVRWARAGHQVFIGSRDAQRGRDKAAEFAVLAGQPIQGGDNAWAVEQGEIALLSVPYAAHAATLQALAKPLKGRLLIDITVPLRPPKVRRVHLPEGGAAALEARQLLGEDTPVVAALHHVSSVHLGDPDHPIDSDVLVCGDQDEAKETVMGLVKDLGLRPVDAGPLANAVALESLTPVLLHINKRYKSKGAGLRITGVDADTRAGSAGAGDA